MLTPRLLTLRATWIAAATVATGLSACGSEVTRRTGQTDTGSGGATGQGGEAQGPQTATGQGGGGGGLGGGTGQGGFGGSATQEPLQLCYIPQTPEDCAAAEDASPYLPPQGCQPAVVLSGPDFAEGNCCYLVDPGDPSNCAAGRPFVVDGVARRAPLDARRTEWSIAEVASAAIAHAGSPDLPAAVRPALAEAWASDALAEHASIAAFARHALAWLAVGAPPDLVADAHRAAIDEIAHARVAFALASAYAGSPLAPGAIDLGGALTAESLAELAAATAAEGCVEEAIAAAVVAYRAEACEAAPVAALLRTIAADEARHAALSFRFVAWAIAHGGPTVKTAVAASVARATARVRGAHVAREATEGENALAHEGVVSGGLLASAVRRALDEAVEPALDALLGAALSSDARA